MIDPIQEKYRQKMNNLATSLDDMFNGKDCPAEKKKVGFSLFIYEFGAGPTANRMNYISNEDRMDFVASLKEMLAQCEGRLHKDPGSTQ